MFSELSRVSDSSSNSFGIRSGTEVSQLSNSPLYDNVAIVSSVTQESLLREKAIQAKNAAVQAKNAAEEQSEVLEKELEKVQKESLLREKVYDNVAIVSSC